LLGDGIKQTENSRVVEATATSGSGQSN